MSVIAYNQITRNWTHPAYNFHFGRGTVMVASPSPSSISFVMQQQGGRVGPLVGILTSRSSTGKTCGDWKRFSSLQKELRSRGGISFVFTPEDMHDSNITGYVLLENDTWRACSFPYPDVVYNRIPYRSHEKRESCQHALSLFSSMGISVVNPYFFSKWDVHKTLFQNEKVRPFLLPTFLLDGERLTTMLQSHKSLYVKQCESSKGKNLYFMRYAEGEVAITSANGTTVHSKLSGAWDLIAGNAMYLAQPALDYDTYHNRKYDLRVLVHSLSGSFTITGVGIRVAAIDQIATHVHNGGELIHETDLSRPIRHDILEELVQQCGNSLCRHFGNVREFSMDIGIDKQGNYFIYECNAKPMIFDEKEISMRAIENIVTIFEEEAFTS